ncbi:2-polyprenyl-3-methyl-5-hydroxy-6-metoxy-1,4-benzoquinol methylase [Candidatus Methanophagaceae archaeon]|jgi:SAM-dependent methyltransferase|nr:2-polyprenyl-3-methyl-5-hydroxy-6-metoxy-1,4-benzoquinol methylase [Methanophagales archaeon]
MELKPIAKNLLVHTPYYPVHIGNYIRSLYFQKYLGQLPVEKVTNVLDAGCGGGQYAIKMAKRFPWIVIIAMDIKVQKFQSNCPSNFFFRQGNLLELKDKDTYDFVYCIDVLEHIPNNTQVIERFYQALKNGGYLYLHMPYDIGKKRIFPDKFFAEFNTWAEEEHIGGQYTLDEMKSILHKIGFEIIAAENTFGFMGELAWELDRVTDKRIALKIFLMPLLKLLGQVSVNIKHTSGNILVLARKLGGK